MKRLDISIAALAACLSTPAIAGMPVFYVDASAPAGGDGISWATAFNDLQVATSAVSGATEPTELWVRAGTYIPVQFFEGDPRLKSFFVLKNVATLGGFNGTETSASQRDPALNVTILSGDIGNPGVFSDNSVRLVWAGSTANSTAILDGFTITGANANASVDRGAGLFSDGSPVIRNCKFIGNFATWQGSAVYSNDPITFENCEFRNNSGATQGGAVHINAGGLTTFTDCLFRNNTNAQSVVSGPCQFTGCEFLNNVAMASQQGQSFVECDFTGNGRTVISGTSGGGPLNVVRCRFIDNGRPTGTAYAINYDNSTQIVNIYNSEFIGNFAGGDGGALRLRGSQVNILNCIVAGNTCGLEGGGIYITGGTTAIANSTVVYNECGFSAAGIRGDSLIVDNCILWGNDRNGVVDQSAQIENTGTPVVRHNCIQGLAAPYIGDGNIGADPAFFDPLGVDLAIGTEDDDWRILPTSPCIDAGRNNSVFADGFDLDGDFITFEFTPYDVHDNPRFFDVVRVTDTGSGTAPIVDIGALESDGNGPPDDPGDYIGPKGGSWFVASHWASNSVPNASSNITISAPVLIDQPGAVANNIVIENGGEIFITTGSLATGDVIIESGAAITLADESASLVVANLTRIDGSELDWQSGSIRLLAGGAFANGAVSMPIGCTGLAELVVEENAVFSAATITICADGTVSGSGTLGANVINEGTIEPGDPIGILRVEGSYSQAPTGVLRTELAGYVAGESYDRLLLMGSAPPGGVLAGTLDVVLDPTFAPMMTGEHRVLVVSDGAGYDGAFNTAIVPSLSGAFEFNLVYAASHIRLDTLLLNPGPRMYVSAGAPPGGDGQSWTTASNDLAAVLDFMNQENTNATAGGSGIHEVWVSAGTYVPDIVGADRERSFEIGAGIAMFGGFDGTESDISERDWIANETILSGDLLGNDIAPGSFLNYNENSYHVVRMECIGFPCAAPSTFDGFTITAGNANGPSNEFHNANAGVTGSDGATYMNCRFTYNQAAVGAVALSTDSNALVSWCEFVGNRSTSGGSTVRLSSGSTMADCRFEANQADQAGFDTSNTGDLLIERCVFESNEGHRTAYISTNEFFVTQIVNCEFIANAPGLSDSAVLETAANSVVNISGCTFSTNSLPSFFSRSTLTMTDCLFEDNADTAFIAGGPATVTGTDFIGNTTTELTAGAVLIDGGPTTFTNCNFLNNSGTEGGGIDVSPGGSALLIACTVAGNTSSGVGDGVYNLGTLIFGADVTMQDGIYNLWFLQPGGNGAVGTMNLGGGLSNAVVTFTSTDTRRGTLFYDVGGTVQGVDYDLIDTGSSSVLLEGGTLQTNFINGYTPSIGDTFELLKHGASTGSFDFVATSAPLPAGLTLDVEHGASATTATFDELLTPTDVALPFNALPVKVEMADLNGDSLQDLLLLFSGAVPNEDPGELVVHLNAGFDGPNWLGFLGAEPMTMVGIDPRDLIIARLDGDEWLDVAIPCVESNAVAMLINAADSTGDLLPGTDLAVDLGLSAVCAVPTTTNAANLMVVAAEGIPGDSQVIMREYVNDGFGAFSPGTIVTPFSLNSPTVVRAVDVDLDFDIDVAALRSSGGNFDVNIWLYDSEAGVYESTPVLPVGSGTKQLIVTDLNDDAYPDLMTEDGADETISLIFNPADGTGLFKFRQLLIVGDETKSLTVPDLDLDSDPDLLFITKGSMNEHLLRHVRNNLTAMNEFVTAAASDVGTASVPLLLITGDVDNDQSPDAVLFEPVPDNVAGSKVTAVVYINPMELTPCPADIVSSATFQPPPDGTVDAADLAYLLGEWGTNRGSLADMVTSATFQPPPDGVVDAADLAVLLGSWGVCK